MNQVSPPGRLSIIGERAVWFWAGCAAISAGIVLHLPMLAHAHEIEQTLTLIRQAKHQLEERAQP